MITVKTPGKLYIAGEYAVVQPGHGAVLMSVNRFITVNIKKSNKKGSIKSYSNVHMVWSRQDNKIVIEKEDDRFLYIVKAIQITEEYLTEKNIKLDFYDIEVMSELESTDGIKYGLGSSAAVVVSIIKALLRYYNIIYTKFELFKLSALASILINTNSSCGDIASSAFTGIIRYTSFDRDKIHNRYKNESISQIIQSEWEDLDITNININQDFNFLIGWTKTPASSNILVENSKKNINKELDFYESFLIKSDNIVDEFVEGYKNRNFKKIKTTFRKNRELLRDYAKYFSITIETKELNNLIEIALKDGMASKTSGAGGGDCGIALYTSDMDALETVKKWKENCILNLDLRIYED